MKKGFTLVELSIVLVIIGLLIGGILIGQSLIESAKINKAVSQIQQFDIAVQQFKIKYQSLPGDSNKFQHGGNNNGFIEGGFVNNPSVTYTRQFRGENRNFWPLLQLNGFKIEGLTTQLPIVSYAYTSSASATGENQDIPLFALGKNTGVIPFHKKVITEAEGRFVNGGTNTSEAIPPVNFYY